MTKNYVNLKNAVNLAFNVTNTHNPKPECVLLDVRHGKIVSVAFNRECENVRWGFDPAAFIEYNGLPFCLLDDDTKAAMDVKPVQEATKETFLSIIQKPIQREYGRVNSNWSHILVLERNQQGGYFTEVD